MEARVSVNCELTCACLAFQTSLAAALSRYESEHAHCERLERSWRDAEARVSALRLELDGLRGLTTQDGHADAAETAE
jgi:hypothetical protein